MIVSLIYGTVFNLPLDLLQRHIINAPLHPNITTPGAPTHNSQISTDGMTTIVNVNYRGNSASGTGDNDIVKGSDGSAASWCYPVSSEAAIEFQQAKQLAVRSSTFINTKSSIFPCFASSIPATLENIQVLMAKQFSVLSIISDNSDTSLNDDVNNYNLYHHQWCIRDFISENKELAYEEGVSTDDNLQDTLEYVRKTTLEKSRLFETIADDTVKGVLLLELFIMDILGQQSEQAVMLQEKLILEKNTTADISIYMKILGYIICCIVVLSMGVGAMMILLRGDDTWQMTVYRAWILQLLFEIVIIETSHCLLIHYILPRQYYGKISNSIWKVFDVVIDRHGRKYRRYQVMNMFTSIYRNISMYHPN